MKELEKTYDPAGIEGKLYQKWLDKNISTLSLIRIKNHLPL